MIWIKLRELYTVLMGKDDTVSKAEDKANALLDTFIESYLKLHDAIHHRDDGSEQKKLKKVFPDIHALDEIVEGNLYKFATHINKMNKQSKK